MFSRIALPLILAFSTLFAHAGDLTTSAQIQAQHAFQNAKGPRWSVETAMQLVDVRSLTAQAMSKLSLLPPESDRRVRAALSAYLVNSLQNFLNTPEKMKNTKLDNLFARVFLSTAERERLLNLPTTFNVLKTEESNGLVVLTLQMYPELTQKDDLDSRLTLVMRSTAKGLRLVDMKAADVSVITTLIASLKSYSRDGRVVIQELLRKGLISEQQITAYSRIW